MKSVDDIISGLTEDLNAVQRLQHPALRILPWLALAVIYTLIVALMLGMRDDLINRLQDPLFLIEIGLVTFITISAALCSSWLCVPDMRGRQGMLWAPLLGLLVFALWVGGRMYMEGPHPEDLQWRHCLPSCVLMGLVPMALLVFLMRKGATTRPLTMSLMNVLAVAGFGYIGLALVCPNEAVEHILLNHLGPFMVAGGLIGLLARRLYRW